MDQVVCDLASALRMNGLHAEAVHERIPSPRKTFARMDVPPSLSRASLNVIAVPLAARLDGELAPDKGMEWRVSRSNGTVYFDLVD